VGKNGDYTDVYTWAVGDPAPALAPVNVSNRAGNDRGATISGRRVVWLGVNPPGNDDVYTCVLGGVPINITKTPGDSETRAQAAGELVVWQGAWEGRWAIFGWSESRGKFVIGADVGQDSGLGTSGNRLVWSGYGGAVYVWAPGDVTPTNVNTVPLVSGLHPRISGNRVVWQGDKMLEPFDQIYTVKLNEPTSTVLTGTSGTRTTAYNTAATIYADLKSGGAPVSGKSVVLELSFNGTSGWKRVATTISQPTPGRYQASVKRTSTGFYRFRFEGGLRYEPATGPVVKVYPKVRLTRSTSWATLYLSKTYKSLGYVEPRHYSTSGKVVIRAYKRRANGTYAGLTYPTKTFSAGSAYSYYSSTKTRYSVPVRLTSRGYWKLVAYHVGDAANAGTYGSPDYVVVK
jgi:hypothetical protein